MRPTFRRNLNPCSTASGGPRPCGVWKIAFPWQLGSGGRQVQDSGADFQSRTEPEAPW